MLMSNSDRYLPKSGCRELSLKKHCTWLPKLLGCPESHDAFFALKYIENYVVTFPRTQYYYLLLPMKKWGQRSCFLPEGQIASEEPELGLSAT